ncbi:hypothetical protein [Desulfovibrio sp.]|uniref:hypothetical protein n=1 Tax=Desulfovibrio sp. TaxID=885 RepID=UPI0023C1C429|nr:hypothetical protein [Desulfovibrio sp.]MDE7242047.1 hypothetical protein [Desulfovibrio sp.]
MKGQPENAARTVSRATALFLRAAADVAPLNYVRAHPVRSVSCSFLLGLSLSFLRRNSGGLALLPLLLQTTELAARLGFIDLPGRKGDPGD